MSEYSSNYERLNEFTHDGELIIFDHAEGKWAGSRHWLYRLPFSVDGGLIGRYLDSWNLEINQGCYKFRSQEATRGEGLSLRRTHTPVTANLASLIAPLGSPVEVTWRCLSTGVVVSYMERIGRPDQLLVIGDRSDDQVVLLDYKYFSFITKLAESEWSAYDLRWTQTGAITTFVHAAGMALIGVVMPVKMP